MNTFLICAGIFYLACFLWMWYEFKHAIIVPDDFDLDNWCTQEELDELLKNRGQSDI